ncbi:MAG: toxic anion resistance protein [Clostridia bacterium]|nr:toxic anion resistance protein [Clostridia bacterium]MDY5558579.1 toxic anion resistance protein [Candidatus Heritagella sp.]
MKLTLEEEVPAAPSLTLDAQEEKKEEVAPVKPVTVEDTPLTPEERKIVDDFAEKIDVTNTTQVMQYGSAAQKKIAGFSETALNNVRTKDLGEVGDAITGLITELKGFDATEEEKGFRGFFKRSSNKLAAMKAKYDKVEVNVDRISGVLDQHQITLMKDIAMLDKMYEMNLSYFKELSMYILAGKKKLNEVQTTVLPQLVEKAKRTGLPEDAQAANDLNSMCESFDKKLHDLELTRMVSIQMGPQIRLVQNNDKIMAEKIQSTLVNTIPLWKSQMVLALGLAHSQQAMQAQRAVTDMTNELLRKNADALKMGSIETAKEAERGVVDIETLKHTNEQLISTLDEVKRIQDEGREKRRAAEEELGRIEGQLKEKLLQVRGN